MNTESHESLLGTRKAGEESVHWAGRDADGVRLPGSLLCSMPELDGHLYVPILEIVCFIGIAGLWFATYLRFLNKAPLRPLHDPRLNEAVVFQNA